MAATLTDPLIGHLVDGRYEVLSRVARGGMATVYLAVDRRLDREVALKVLHPHLAEGASGADFQARFRREARSAARLTHPGLVGVLDQGVDGETSYLAMEYVDGSNLRRRLTEDGPLSLDEALRTTESVLEALSVAHRAGLVHRDIKPENVLIAAEDGRVKVADFGLARAVTEATYTATGTVLGTVAYLSPELVTHGSSDARTDVYAVGICLFEMLTGTQPYTGETPIQVAYQHVHRDIPAPSERVSWLPTEIDELVEALAARDPDERPADAAAALSLVRRTRAALDAGLLARRADAPPSPPATDGGDEHEDEHGSARADDKAADPDATELLGLSRPRPPARDGDVELRRTIALKLGAGAVPAAPPPRSETAPGDRPARQRLAVVVAVVVALLAAAGFGAWWFLQGPGAFRSVPDGLVGATQQDAQAVLDDAGLGVAITTDFHPEVPKGSVYDTDPAIGTQVRRDGTVTLFVSLGPDLREVPAELGGKPFTDVKAALELAGFEVPDPTTRWHDSVPADAVISLTGPDGNAIEGGVTLPVGTTISALVSKGPEPIVVPAVLGEERQRAIAILETDYGLQVTVDEDHSEEHAAGLVAAQSLEPGTGAHRRDAITITVSLGPPMIQMINVERMEYGEAKAQLEELGFVVSRKNSWGGLIGQVVDQDLEPGATVPKGTTVTLTVV